MARKIVRGQGPAKGKKVANKTGGKKTAAEGVIKDLQQQGKDSAEEPAGLDELIKSIQKEVKDNDKKKNEDKKKMSALVKVVTETVDKKDDKIDSLDIEDRVLELLGIEDYEAELDYEQFTTLLKEYFVAQGIGGGKVEKEGDTEALKQALKNSKGKKGKFSPKKKKTVTASGFVGKKATTSDYNKPQKVQTDKLLPSKGQTSSPDNIKTSSPDNTETISPDNIKRGVQEDIRQQLLPLSKSLSEIEKNLGKILDINQKKLEFERQAARDAAKKEETAGFKKTEAQLEDKTKSTKVKDTAENKIKPLANIFDMLGDFFTNVLLGGAVSGFLKFIEDPGKVFKGITDFLNSTVIPFVNGIIDFVSTVMFFSINTVIDGINAGLDGLENLIEQVQKIIPIPDITFPDIPNIKIPNVPDIPDGFGLFQKQEGGGEVINVNNLSLFDGGAIDSKTGTKITGMGKDTQLIAAQPGEIMFSKKAVDMFGADNLLSANAMAGGNNTPKFGKVLGFQDGGQIGGTGFTSGLQTGASKFIGGSTDYHIDTKFSKDLGMEQIIAMMDQMSRGYSQRGRVIEFSNRGVAGKRYSHADPPEKKADLLVKVFGAHKQGDMYSADYYIPAINDPKGREGKSAEGAEIIVPTIKGGTLEYYDGPDYGAFTVGVDKSGKVLFKTGHGDNRVNPLKGTKIKFGTNVPEAPTNMQKAQVSKIKTTITEVPPPVFYGGGGTTVLPIPTGQQNLTSAASAAQGRVPSFNAEDDSNYDLLTVKSIYNTVG